MNEETSGSHAITEQDLFQGFRIAVPFRRISEVCRILSVHRIPHAIEVAVASNPGYGPRPALSLHEGSD